MKGSNWGSKLKASVDVAGSQLPGCLHRGLCSQLTARPGTGGARARGSASRTPASEQTRPGTPKGSPCGERRKPRLPRFEPCPARQQPSPSEGALGVALSIIMAHPVARLFPRKTQKGVQACSQERYKLLPVPRSSVTVPFSKPEWGHPPGELGPLLRPSCLDRKVFSCVPSSSRSPAALNFKWIEGSTGQSHHRISWC